MADTLPPPAIQQATTAQQLSGGVGVGGSYGRTEQAAQPIVQGQGFWGGYVGPGMENLTDPARTAALETARAAGGPDILAMNAISPSTALANFRSQYNENIPFVGQIPESLGGASPLIDAYRNNPNLGSQIAASTAKQEDAYQEQRKQALAFSEARTPTGEASPYRAAVLEAASAPIGTPGASAVFAAALSNRSYWMPTAKSPAATIASEIAARGGNIGSNLLSKAAAGGFAGAGLVNVIPDRSVIATPSKISTLPLTMSAGDIAARASPGITTAVAIGNYQQAIIPESKTVFGKNTGEFGIYAPNYSNGVLRGYGLVSSGGRAAAQSGAFTFNAPETPNIMSREGTRNFVSTPLAYQLTHSRLGAEAYGGYVLALDDRTVQSTGAQYSTYTNPNNFANFVNPQGANMSKAQAPGISYPYSIGAGSPTIQYADKGGIIPGSAVAAPGEAGRLVGGGKVASVGEIIPNAPIGLTAVGIATPEEIYMAGVGTKVTYTPSSPSALNFIENLGSNVINTATFGLLNLPTTRGFATTTTETTAPVGPIKSGGADYTPVLLNPYTGAKSVPVLVTTSITTPEKSVYGTINESLSKYIPDISESTKANLSRGYLGSFALGGFEAARQNPLDIPKNVSLAIITMGASEYLGGAATAVAAGTRLAPTVETIGRVTPYAFGAVYGGSVAERATSNFSDFSTKGSERLGGIVATETIPFIAGGVGYANRDAIATGVVDAARFADRQFSIPMNNEAGTLYLGKSDLIKPQSEVPVIDLRQVVDLRPLTESLPDTRQVVDLGALNVAELRATSKENLISLQQARTLKSQRAVEQPTESLTKVQQRVAMKTELARQRAIPTVGEAELPRTYQISAEDVVTGQRSMLDQQLVSEIQLVSGQIATVKPMYDTSVIPKLEFPSVATTRSVSPLELPVSSVQTPYALSAPTISDRVAAPPRFDVPVEESPRTSVVPKFVYSTTEASTPFVPLFTTPTPEPGRTSTQPRFEIPPYVPPPTIGGVPYREPKPPSLPPPPIPIIPIPPGLLPPGGGGGGAGGLKRGGRKIQRELLYIGPTSIRMPKISKKKKR